MIENKIRVLVAVAALTSSSLAPAHGEDVTASVVGNWFYAEGTDPVTDLRKGLAALYSKDGKSGIAFQCDNSMEDRPLFFTIKSPDRAFLPERPKVTVRSDAGEPQTFVGMSVSEHTLIGEPWNVQKLARLLVGADHTFVRILDTDGQPIDADFPVGKPQDVFAKVAMTCGKDEGYINKLLGLRTP